jgi:hypothetical protein
MKSLEELITTLESYVPKSEHKTQKFRKQQSVGK